MLTAVYFLRAIDTQQVAGRVAAAKVGVAETERLGAVRRWRLGRVSGAPQRPEPSWLPLAPSRKAKLRR